MNLLCMVVTHKLCDCNLREEGTQSGYDWSLKKFLYKWNIKEIMKVP